MAYHEIMIVVAVMLAYVFAFYVGRFSVHGASTRGYMRGWAAAKQVYYTDIREERIAEEARQRKQAKEDYEALRKENSEYFTLSSDVLMAYGVNTVGQLPKSVRDMYGIKEDQTYIDLDTLLRNEGIAQELDEI